MSLPYRTFELSASPERIYKAVLTGELSPFFKRAGMFAVGGMAKHFKWKEQSDSSLLGKVGYFRSKNNCVLRFRLRCVPQGDRTQVTLSVEHGPWSLILMIVTYVLGLCICVVGVIFPFIGFKMMKRGQNFALQFLQTHLVDWDLANREGGPPAITGGLIDSSLPDVPPPALPFLAVPQPENVGTAKECSLSEAQPCGDIGAAFDITSSEREELPDQEPESGPSSRWWLLPALGVAGALLLGITIIGILKDSPEADINGTGNAEVAKRQSEKPAAGQTASASDAYQRPPLPSPTTDTPFSTSPDGKYSVEIKENPQQGRYIFVAERGELLFEEPAMGYLQDVHWSPGRRFVAINERRGNSGDYLWILDLQRQQVLKRPDDSIWQKMESKCIPILRDKAAKKWGEGVHDDRDWGSASGWKDENTLLATVTVLFQGSSIAVGEDSKLEADLRLSVKPDGVSLLEEKVAGSRSVGDGLLFSGFNIELIEETETLISTFEWYARFGAERTTVNIRDLDLDSVKIGIPNERGALEGGVSVEIPLKTDADAKKERWTPSDSDFSWSMPPNSLVATDGVLETVALSQEKAAALVSALKAVKLRTDSNPPDTNSPEVQMPSSRLSAYAGKVGRLEAQFELQWHPDRTVTGRYWHPGRNPELKYGLKGSNPKEGELILDEFTDGERTATIRLNKDSSQGITWIGRMSNTDGRQFDVTMARLDEPTADQSSRPDQQPSVELLAFSNALKTVWTGGALSADSLAGLSPWELKILRNAIFARHGRVFESGKLSGFFHRYPGYKEDAGYSDIRITPTDRSNAEAIKALESRAQRPSQDTAWNALRGFVDALAAGDVEFIASLVHPSTPVELVMFTLDDPPKVAYQERLSGNSKELKDLWLDDGANGESYCFMMGALWNFTLSAENAGNGMFRNKGSSTEIGFTEISGKWWLTRVSDAAP